MAEEQRKLSVGDIHEATFYQADAELNKTVFRVIETSLRGAAASAIVSLFFRHKARVIWAGVGFGAGYEYYNAHLNFDKYKRSTRTEFDPVAETVNFPKEEEKILAYWKKIDAFKRQLELTQDKPPYTFYDGPPFATGLPHYGHICAGTIKDVITRYAAQNGHYVERRFGWDCHGLPIEYEIDKAYGIKTRDDVLKIGISEYNKLCRGIVMRYSAEWEEIVHRLGRWIDFKNDYKTMDLSFMESVWWTFKQLWDKRLVYRGAKVMPYSNGCSTVLSNFEAGSNYQMVNDPSIFIEFPLVSDQNVSLVAWTTTPWTLPSNLALAVNPNFVYLKIKDLKRNKVYIIAENRLISLYDAKKKDYEVLAKYKGSELVGLEYQPLFKYFESYRSTGCFQVLSGDFVSSDSGTGVVHCAPAFGAEDFDLCMKAKIVRPDNIPCPLDANGRFTDQVKDFKGQYIKDKACERGIITAIKAQGRLMHESQHHHSYPFCWRSDTPLIYKAVSSWFIKVTDIKENLIKNNHKAYWVPKNAQEGRFQNWLEDAKDWCFSRNRFWGNPIPIWVSEDFEEQICVGSVQELKELTGIDNITDLHRESIDHLTIPSRQGKGKLRRIDEVFDCWFESGAMPFASFHYPFGISEQEFTKRFPADFIGEGLDQTRGWFYTLNVLATAIKNDTPYKNLIVNGLVLAADGKKMSKRLKNYPDPQKLIDSKGADAIRLYLMNSPLTRADTLNFKEEGVAAIVRDVLLPWYNGYRFLIQNVTRWETNTSQKFQYSETYRSGLSNLMDKWIIASNQNLIKQVRKEMDSYKLYNVLPKLLHFLEDLTNWYIRLNRGRLRGEFGENDLRVSLNVLTEVLFNITVLMAPFVPFITDGFYQNLRKIVSANSKLNQDSVHFIDIPKFDPNLINERIETDVQRMQQVIELGRQIRDRRKVSVKQPIMSLTVISMQQQVLDSIRSVESYIQDELNVDRIEYTTQFSKYLSLHSQPNHKVIGARLKKHYTNEMREKLANLLPEEIAKVQKGEKIILNNFDFGGEDIEIVTKIKSGKLEEYQELAGQAEFHILLDLRQDDAMKQRGITREVINRIQKLRKKLSLSPSDEVSIYISIPGNSVAIKTALSSQKELLSQSLKRTVAFGKPEDVKDLLAEEEFDFDDEHFTVAIVRN